MDEYMSFSSWVRSRLSALLALSAAVALCVGVLISLRTEAPRPRLTPITSIISPVVGLSSVSDPELKAWQDKMSLRYMEWFEAQNSMTYIPVPRLDAVEKTALDREMVWREALNALSYPPSAREATATLSSTDPTTVDALEWYLWRGYPQPLK